MFTLASTLSKRLKVALRDLRAFTERKSHVVAKVVCLASEKVEIFGSIIFRIFVDMVYDFFFSKFSPQKSLNYKPVLKNPIIIPVFPSAFPRTNSFVLWFLSTLPHRVLFAFAMINRTASVTAKSSSTMVSFVFASCYRKFANFTRSCAFGDFRFSLTFLGAKSSFPRSRISTWESFKDSCTMLTSFFNHLKTLYQMNPIHANSICL